MLFFIQAQAFTGDADGPNNMDLFVHGKTVSEAIVAWKKHFEDWDMPDDKVRCYHLRTAVRGPNGVLPWEQMQCTEVECEGGDGPVVCPGCEAVEGTSEWGTVGDGFDGYCPSCADKRDPG